MKKILFLSSLSLLLSVEGSPAEAQMFYRENSSSFNSVSSPSTSEPARRDSASSDPYAQEPYEKMVSGDIRERIKPDAASVLAQPDEVLCYGIARKSPKKRGPTIDGYAHTGNCGVLNDVGLAEVQKKILRSESFDMNVSKIASCIVTPRLVLRFRKGSDFVDAVLSGGNCPGVLYLYGGETKEFSARPMSEWLDTFIEAVSKDLEPLGQEKNEAQNSLGALVKRRDPGAEDAAPSDEPPPPPAPRRWGRQFN